MSSKTDTTSIRIAPSILASDWSNVEREVKSACDAGADLLHVDVMDGHFVPVITFGPQMVEAIKKHSSVPLDVHLMIEKPERQVASFISAGADILTVHEEVSPHLHRTLQAIREQGAKAGVALNPGTPIENIQPVLPLTDLLLIMSVNPGWGGQKFIEESAGRIRQARHLINECRNTIHLEVDGGINKETAETVLRAGADTLVAGTFVFGSTNYKDAITALRTAASN